MLSVYPQNAVAVLLKVGAADFTEIDGYNCESETFIF
jgi:hypothetical protein